MKRFIILQPLLIFAGLLVMVTGIRAQDVHFAQVQDMNVWYNPALKTNKTPLAHANIRSVKYQGITAYTSKAITIDLPLVSRDAQDLDNVGYMNLSAGLNGDNSSGGSVNVSAAMMAFSYALPLNDDNTYLAAGFQGAYTFSRFTYNSYGAFPGQFDQNGPIGMAVLTDPLGTGNTYSYFTAGAGAAFFHTGERKQWYIGASVRHFNQPLVDPDLSASFRLPMNRGIQLGYTTAVSDDDIIGGYASFSWQGSTHEHTIGALYTRNLGDSATSAVYLGVGYRLGDAVMPGLGFKAGRHRFLFDYEFNITSNTLVNYSRQSLEFSYTYVL